MSGAVLVVGAGYVGGALCERLLETRQRVFALSRSGHAPPQSLGIAADVADADALHGALGRAGVFDEPLAGAVYLVSAGGRSDEAYARAYVEGMTNLCEVLAKEGQGGARLLFVSSTSVYEGQDGGWVDEDTEVLPAGFAGRRMLQAERVAAGSPLRACALRFGGIYGPGRTRLVERVAAGEALTGPDAPRYQSRIHRDDGAAAAAHVLGLDDPAPIYLVVDDDPADLRDVQRWLAERLGVLGPLRPPAKLPAGAGKRCRNDRLRQTGLHLVYPTFRQGYAALLPSPPAPQH